MTKAQQTEKQEATERLRELLKPGQEVLCILRHVSRSGMQRVIDLKVVNAAGEVEGIGWSAAIAMGDRFDRKREGIVVGGCGMGVGFGLVYNLSSLLFRGGFGCIGKGESGSGRYCPSNDHQNGDRDYTPHGICADCKDASHVATPGHETTHWHKSGGYALKHRWL